MMDPHAAAVTRAADEGPRMAGIGGQCESSQEADCCCGDSPCNFKEAEAAALPPEGDRLAPWDGPAARMMDPHACGCAAALPPEGDRLAPWDGPAALMAQ